MSKRKPVYTDVHAFKSTEGFTQMIESAWRINNHESKTEFFRNAITYYCICCDQNKPLMKVFRDIQEVEDYESYLTRPYDFGVKIQWSDESE